MLYQTKNNQSPLTRQNWPFNIRVYGLFIDQQNRILLTDEYRMGMKMTKFPGGGLEPGEGTIDCLKREMQEECHQKIENIRHFYTTDFYQKALFANNQQLISIYYKASLLAPLKFQIANSPFTFSNGCIEGAQSFRWESIAKLKSENLSFPVDRQVLKYLQNEQKTVV